MWEINNTSQILSFLYSVGFGCLCCAVYDMFRMLRRVGKPGAVAVFVQDIVYALLCAFFCFCFLLSVTGGKLRFYVFAGMALGFLLFRLTLSRLLFPPFVWIAAHLAQGYRLFCRAGGRFLDRFEAKVTVFKAKAWAFCKKNGKQVKKLLKKGS